MYLLSYLTEKKTNKFVKFTENYVIKSQSNLAVKVLEVVKETSFPLCKIMLSTTEKYLTRTKNGITE